MKTFSTFLIVCAAVLAAPISVRGESDPGWPQFRGPYLNGTTEGNDLPVKFGKSENVAWLAPLPGPGAATPCVWQEHVFVSSFDRGKKDVLAIALDRTTGKVRWRQVVAQHVPFRDSRGSENFLAAPSPATDGQRVIFLSGTGDLVALDFDGNVLWHRSLQEDYGRFRIIFGYAASPLLHEGRLFIQVLHRVEDSYLLAIDPVTGQTQWKQPRPTDAVAESMEGYATPVVFRRHVLVVGGDYLTAHNPTTGAEQWRWSGINPRKQHHFRVVTSPVVGDDLIFVSAPQLSPMYGIRVKQGRPQKIWTFKKPTSDTPTPIFDRGRLFVLAGRKKMVTCLQGKTGETLWQGPLDVKTYLRASPTLADGKIYCISANGEVVVLASGNRFKVLGGTDLGEYPCRSSIVIHRNQLLIRTGENLYCIGT